VTITAPPRSPRESERIDRVELEALVEALIEEARKRAQRRRRRNAAVVTLIALVGVALFAVLGRSAQSQTASPALSARSTSAGQEASRIAFINEGSGGGYCGTVWVMNPDGSGQRRLTNGGVAGCGQEWGHVWSPNGREIAFVGNLDGKNGIYVMNADGSGLERLTSPLPGRCDGRAHWDDAPAWSPDGRAIAFTRSYCGRRYSEIYVMNADGSEQRMLTRNPARKYDPTTELAWSPLGDAIAFVSPRDGNPEVYLVNADGSERRRLTRNTVRDSNPVWSPNGRRIAFESNWQVWVMNADGSGQRRLTRNGGRNVAPAWSPDGQRIAFERRLGRRQSLPWCSGCGSALYFEVWVMNANGSQARLLARDAAQQPSWSPDGRKIAFTRQIGERQRRGGRLTDIYVMNADGSGQRALTRGADRESQPVWSPPQR
jgi:Tol biopolymer transport system component